MWIRILSAAFLSALASGAKADFSILCDERAQIEDILKTAQTHGFHDATMKFRAYRALQDDQNQPTCDVTRVPGPTSVGPVVSTYEGVEFLPDQLHDVLIVEIKVGERTLFGTLNHFVAPRPAEKQI